MVRYAPRLRIDCDRDELGERAASAMHEALAQQKAVTIDEGLEITFEQVPRVTVSSYAQSVDIHSWESGNSNLPASYFPREKSEWLPKVDSPYTGPTLNIEVA
jgi:hypothetical protein